MAYLGVLEFSRPHVKGDSLRLDTFVGLLADRRVRDVRILDFDSYVVGTYQPLVAPVEQPADPAAPSPDEVGVRRYNVPLVAGGQTDLLNLVLGRVDLPVTVDQQGGKRAVATASVLFPGLILVMLFVYLILSYRRGTGMFGVHSGARRVAAETSSTTFADVAGQDGAVTELREITQFLSEPERFLVLGAQVPKGVLLYGPPGCGKTLLARALAGESGAAFFSISGSDFVELYVGVGASRVRDLFREAREHSPSVIFIDELDSVGRARSTAGAVSSQAEQEQALNQVLAEMDGFSASDGILVVAATNRPDVLDPALLRPGRFDRTVGLERPDEAARLAILSVHAKRMRVDDNVDLAAVARRAIGLTGADLANVTNEAALLAARDGRSDISQVQLERALHRILEAPERQRRLSMRERSIGKRFTSEERVTFADVAGADDALSELREVRDHLADPERVQRLGGRAPRGILLSGAPGCGKTLIARAVAGEANAAFLSVAASEFVEVFVGQGASRVRELFAEARSVAPAIVFIDEIDAIGRSRTAGVGQGEHDQTLNQFLVELDGFTTDVGVIVIAATNRRDMLDPALIRPGRFDRHVAISLPDRAGRLAILRLHATGKRLAADVDLAVVAGLTTGFSGADLANSLNEAALLAARRELDEIPMVAVEEGIDRALMGVDSHRTSMSEDERRIAAYHEAGHGLVGLALPDAPSFHKLTIVPRGGSLGRCSTLDDHERVMHSRSSLVHQMAALLGGLATEELVFGEPGSGSGSDLQRATRIARLMVCELGMSEAVGPVFRSAGGTAPAECSEDAARTIDTEVRRYLDEAKRTALDVLVRRRPQLDRVATVLLERETLSADELANLADATPGTALPTITRVSAGPMTTREAG